jgi:hypothetical protein
VAIEETIIVDAGPGIAGLNAFADAAAKAAAKYDASMAKLKPPAVAGGAAGALFIAGHAPEDPLPGQGAISHDVDMPRRPA